MLGQGTGRDADGPVRVSLKKGAGPAHHLGLDPEPEAHSKGLHFASQRFEAPRKLAPVDLPVAERSRVVVPLPEPAVVKHEEFDAQLMCDRGDGHQAVLVVLLLQAARHSVKSCMTAS